MKSKQIFVDTQIDHFGNNMNTDALFEDVGVKECLFSDDECDEKNDDSSDVLNKKHDDSSVFSYKKHDDSSVFSYKKHKETYKPPPKTLLNETNNIIEPNDCLFSDDD